jgi:ATP-binding cassette subfamily B protein
MILGALKRRAGRHTTIVIAHRLSTLMHADQIAVLERGELTQLGTHAELIEKDGLYRRLWQIQTALEEDLSRELADQLPRGERVAELTPLSRYSGRGQA